MATLCIATHLEVANFSNTQLCYPDHSRMNQGSASGPKTAIQSLANVIENWFSERVLSPKLGGEGTKDQLLSIGEFEQ